AALLRVRLSPAGATGGAADPVRVLSIRAEGSLPPTADPNVASVGRRPCSADAAGAPRICAADAALPLRLGRSRRGLLADRDADDSRGGPIPPVADRCAERAAHAVVRGRYVQPRHATPRPGRGVILCRHPRSGELAELASPATATFGARQARAAHPATRRRH